MTQRDKFTFKTSAVATFRFIKGEVSFLFPLINSFLLIWSKNPNIVLAKKSSKSSFFLPTSGFFFEVWTWTKVYNPAFVLTLEPFGSAGWWYNYLHIVVCEEKLKLNTIEISSSTFYSIVSIWTDGLLCTYTKNKLKLLYNFKCSAPRFIQVGVVVRCCNITNVTLEWSPQQVTAWWRKRRWWWSWVDVQDTHRPGTVKFMIIKCSPWISQWNNLLHHEIRGWMKERESRASH